MTLTFIASVDVNGDRINKTDAMGDLPDKKLLVLIGLTFVSGVAVGLLLEKYGYISHCGGSGSCSTGKKG